jgi:hypothetical protein
MEVSLLVVFQESIEPRQESIFVWA